MAQLGLIGGTMGLFTGFSILSGIEIVYFAAKFFLMKIERQISMNVLSQLTAVLFFLSNHVCKSVYKCINV